MRLHQHLCVLASVAFVLSLVGESSVIVLIPLTGTGESARRFKMPTRGESEGRIVAVCGTSVWRKSVDSAPILSELIGDVPCRDLIDVTMLQRQQCLRRWCFTLRNRRLSLLR